MTCQLTPRHGGQICGEPATKKVRDTYNDVAPSGRATSIMSRLQHTQTSISKSPHLQ